MSSASASERFVTPEDGGFALNLLVDGMHCPSCVAIIESALKKQQAVTGARLNLSTRRLKVSWNGEKNLGDQWVSLINGMGYRAMPFDPASAETSEKREEKFLLRCMAVAGFASGNMMLFSVPLWTSDASTMSEHTRLMFQWVQALIAVPAIAYCGLPFYRSAWRALREYRTNMDVPISVAVILATLMSFFEFFNHGAHTYFDSGVMLLFFLLIGRYLDARARGKARSTAHDLLQMMTGFATVLREEGTQQTIPLADIQEGMTLLIAAGEKIGADGTVIAGSSEIDTSLITGETLPRPAQVGTLLFAGMMNLAAPITLKVTKAGERSLLSEIIRLMETAEQSQARYVGIADMVSRWYTPLVHILAAATFIGWWAFMGAQWQVALLYAATVLIITCPCALGLAVPVVQVLASGWLMRRGILLKSGSALERLSAITHVAFDKTGTLTHGTPELQHVQAIPAEALARAASMAVHSKHPLSKALVRAYSGPLEATTIEEVAGCGLAAAGVKLGKASWCGVKNDAQDSALELWLVEQRSAPVRFTFADALRRDAAGTIAKLRAAGLGVELLSGDRQPVVDAVSRELGIPHALAELTPVQKCERLEVLKQQGAKVLMVGDGLNDAPSLASASVSMSPSSAMDITQNAADIVFQGSDLSPVFTSWKIAQFSQTLVKQNFVLAMLYNVIAIPMAVLGHVTPLIAAVAMSSSSLVVIANAMRLNLKKD